MLFALSFALRSTLEFYYSDTGITTPMFTMENLNKSQLQFSSAPPEQEWGLNGLEMLLHFQLETDAVLWRLSPQLAIQIWPSHTQLGYEHHEIWT